MSFRITRGNATKLLARRFQTSIATPEQRCHATRRSGDTCDEPNQLDKACDPGSRFQVLTRTDDAYIVAHCRKKSRDGNGPGQFGDIAVIQHNQKNGATCFYQGFGDKLSGQVKAPSKGGGPSPPPGAWSGPWLRPFNTADIGCGGCHDNGPLIRSPYLNQVEGSNAIPGKDDPSFNRDPQPYAFVGKDFASWKAFKVDADNECTSCHRLGVNNVPVNTFACSHFVQGHPRADRCGTALDFAERATSATEISEEDTRPAHKTFPPNPQSPMWMPPHQVSFDQAHANSAKAIHDCALRLHEIHCRTNLVAISLSSPAPFPPTPRST